MPTKLSWGGYPNAPQRLARLPGRNADLSAFSGPLLPYGNGRSYGDSCLNTGGTLLHTRNLDHFIGFDSVNGLLRCESGVLLSDILDLAVPKGWFLPVTPGTKYVTVGGAIANDVHGKNQHRAGNFGHHVRSFELLRSDGQRLLCSPSANADWFSATVGGLGLTGLITWAEVQLKPITSPCVRVETLPFNNVAEFIDRSVESTADHEYTVGWMDGTAHGKAAGRGIFMRANHLCASAIKPLPASRHRFSVSFTPPASLVNGVTARCFNAWYYHRKRRALKPAVESYEAFFYPLDAVENWNRLYGPRGFLQYQCVVPPNAAVDAISELLRQVSRGKIGSSLAVIKLFGDQPAAGILSFPRAGVTLAMDFPNRGAPTLELLERLDDVVSAAQGAVYPAKDARMAGHRFRRYFPGWQSMLPYLDARFSSSFWRRVME